MVYNNSTYSPTIPDLPPQMISLKEKDFEWKKRCLNTLEQVGRAQYFENVKLIENYEMVKGSFIYKHYFENEGYTDFIAQLTQEFELPSYLRHYDIISQVINTLSGEWQNRPDIFRVKNLSEDASNEYERTKTDLLIKYVTSKIKAEIAKKMLEQGLDPEKEDFNSEEEKQQYQQIIAEAEKQLTPVEVQDYMNTKWSHQAEIWASHQMEYDKQVFNLKEKEKKEFEDMLISDRCFRHFYLTPTGYNQETWNPVQTFFQKSPDVEYIEDGDYVGRIFYLSIPSIIDRYGHLMTKDEILKLQEKNVKEDKQRWNYSAGSEYVFNNYLVPFDGFWGYDAVKKTQPMLNENTASGLPYLDDRMYNSLFNGKFFNERRGLYFVTECYWKSQRKIGKITYIDEETGIKISKFIDEETVIPKNFIQIESSFSDSEEENTVVWTWVNQIWKGIKIALKGNRVSEDIYLDVNPLEFQFKSDNNPYGAKLPVCGQIFSVRNSKSMSLVDLMKPYQIFYNVAMNQLYQICEREIGKFIIFDVNMFPNLKDWGGENSWSKFMMIAKELGMAPADTSPSTTNQSQAAANGSLPKEFNFDESSRIMSRLKLAEAFEQMALRQVGFNQYRLGSYAAYTSAQGAEQGKQASYSQTDTYFTNFSNYLRRCYQMNLAIAQYTQSQNKDIRFMYVKSDMSRKFIKMLGTDILLANLQLSVVNSQEYMRQIETLKQLAIENNTSGATLLELAEVITAYSPEEIKIKLKTAQNRKQKLEDREYELKQQQLEQEKESTQLTLEQNERHFQETIQNNLDIAYIKEGSKIINSDSTPIDNSINDNNEQSKLNQQQNKHDLDRQKLLADSQYKNKKLALDQAKIAAELKMQQEELEYARIMKDKELKQKSKN